MHSQSISLVPAARCGSEGAEEEGEDDRQPENPGGAATSEVIFFPPVVISNYISFDPTFAVMLSV